MLTEQKGGLDNILTESSSVVTASIKEGIESAHAAANENKVV